MWQHTKKYLEQQNITRSSENQAWMQTSTMTDWRWDKRKGFKWAENDDVSIAAPETNENEKQVWDEGQHWGTELTEEKLTDDTEKHRGTNWTQKVTSLENNFNFRNSSNKWMQFESLQDPGSSVVECLPLVGWQIGFRGGIYNM